MPLPSNKTKLSLDLNIGQKHKAVSRAETTSQQVSGSERTIQLQWANWDQNSPWKVNQALTNTGVSHQTPALQTEADRRAHSIGRGSIYKVMCPSGRRKQIQPQARKSSNLCAWLSWSFYHILHLTLSRSPEILRQDLDLSGSTGVACRGNSKAARKGG